MSGEPGTALPIMLQMAKASDDHFMWQRRFNALRQMYPCEHPCFVDRDGDWCLRDAIDYAIAACGFALAKDQEHG